QRESGQPVGFLYDIEIESAFRGRGLGRQLMLLIEEEARRRGFTEIRLNVFGGNELARSLYRSLGYAEFAIAMRKRLTWTGPPGLPSIEPWSSARAAAPRTVRAPVSATPAVARWP